jgi:hypothetical protein
MWVVRRIKTSGSRKIYRKSWKPSADTKLTWWKVACVVMAVLIIAVGYLEHWS